MKRYNYLIELSDGSSTLYNDSLIFPFYKGNGMSIIDSENHSHVFYANEITSIRIVDVNKKIFNSEEAA